MKLTDTLPELEGATYIINGLKNELRDLLNQPATMIHFFSTENELSMKMLEDYQSIVEDYKEKMNFISIHIASDELEDFEIKEILKEKEVHHTVYVDGNNELKEQFQNQFIPSYYLFDRNGALVHYQAGGGGIRMLKKQLEKFVGKK